MTEDSFIFYISSLEPSLFLAPFLVQGFLSLEPISLPRLRRGWYLLDCPTWTSIFIGVFAGGIFDLVIIFLSVNAFGNWFSKICKWIIFWTSSSYYFVRGSRWDNGNSFQPISFFNLLFSPPNVGKFYSSKWQSTNRAVNKSPIVGSRYFIIDRDSYPTYISILLWGFILVQCGRKLKHISYIQISLDGKYYALYQKLIVKGKRCDKLLAWCESMLACKIACPRVEIGSFHLMISCLVINLIRLINDYASPFCVWTCVTRCSMSVPIDIKYL